MNDIVLKPCPFCGGTNTLVRPQHYWTGMRNELISVTITHWCNKIETPLQSLLQIKGRTVEEAVSLWNNRHEN